MWVLQSTVPAGVGTPLEAAQLRVETIRTGLSVGAGAGAAAALLLALRRQQVTERTQQATEYDAGEKRVTELYVKAAEQLGSDKAPVRLAGLYALERLAQDNPVHRQSIVEVICAYLRMPYTPPTEEQSDRSSAEPDAAEATDTAETPNQPTRPDPREERQVRLAAQRILARHLRPKTADRKLSPTYWNGVAIDLTEATILDADFSNCHLNDAHFGRTQFIGTARFNHATFTGDAQFGWATFTDSADFDSATFSGAARFGGATFAGLAIFSKVRFIHDAELDGATFADDTLFDSVTFDGDAGFDGAAFTSDAMFHNATFIRIAWFDEATFEGEADFKGACVGGGNRDDDVWPAGWQVDLDKRRVVRVPVDVKPGTDAEPE
ncbi:pentapeptide repeat-containing protein [Micromonospora sp. LOL_013]|uniref:pentapeptide repeat-containing protein n=1 Tax=Micromonospora sp. LOL_013 TaxID=3345414 RepID=UPI003A8BBE9A